MRTVPEEIARPADRPALPNPQPVEMLDVDWKVVTPDTLPEGRYVLFALTPQQYESLSLNMAELRRWIDEAMWRLDYYTKEGEAPDGR